MFKGHPKGLFILALANMGERFGYYTMLAIFALYLQAKFGFDSGTTGQIFGGFLAAVYFLPLLGGFIADRILGYGKTITLGILVMFAGYALLAKPSEPNLAGKITMFSSLFLISLGTGFFKGNLQALVGNIYDDSRYSIKRDVAFSIFYMFINIGAFFAPSAAEAVSNTYLAKDGFTYSASVPDRALKYLNYKVADSTAFSQKLITEKGLENATAANLKKEIQKAKKKNGVIYDTEKAQIEVKLEESGKDQMGSNFISAEDFARKYTLSLSKSYNWGFAVACVSLVISLLIFLVFRKHYKKADFTERQKAKDESKKTEMIILSKAQVKDRLIALGLVFMVVIFFWMSFHQNGLTMTFFARDYTNLAISPFQNLGFSLISLLPLALGFYGLIIFFQNKELRGRITGILMAIVSIVLIYFYYIHTVESNPEFLAKGTISVTPPKFQQFNPFFIILLTPIFVALFSWLNKKRMEPTAPRKIGIGMVIAGLGFIPLMVASIGLASPGELGGGVSDRLVSANWLISTYFILTLAELFLSPMGISFVSKVAPPQYKGLMQGGWLAATATGNYLVGVMGGFWDKVPLVVFWGILTTCCFLSAIFIFSVIKKLDRATVS